MAKNSKTARKLNLTSSTAAAPTSKQAAPSKPARKLNVAGPAKPTANQAIVAAIKAGKPAAVAAATASTTPAANVATPDKAQSALERQITRDQRYFAQASYPAENEHDPDYKYIGLFARWDKRRPGAVLSIPEITRSGLKPAGISITNNRARAVRLAGFAEPYISFIDDDGKPTNDLNVIRAKTLTRFVMLPRAQKHPAYAAATVLPA